MCVSERALCVNVTKTKLNVKKIVTRDACCLNGENSDACTLSGKSDKDSIPTGIKFLVRQKHKQKGNESNACFERGKRAGFDTCTNVSIIRRVTNFM